MSAPECVARFVAATHSAAGESNALFREHRLDAAAAWKYLAAIAIAQEVLQGELIDRDQISPDTRKGLPRLLPNAA